MIEPTYLSLSDTAKYLDCSVSHVEHSWPQWATEHKVRVHRVGKRMLRINRKDIDRMMEKNVVLGGKQ